MAGRRRGRELAASFFFFALAPAWHIKMRKGDATVPGTLYSEPGSRRMEGGMEREKMK